MKQQERERLRRRTLSFPCLEQPLKCIISYCGDNNNNQRHMMIAARRNGTVYLAPKRQQQKNAEFLLLPCCTKQEQQQTGDAAGAGASQQQDQQLFMFKLANRDQGYLRVNFDNTNESNEPIVTASHLEVTGDDTLLSSFQWKLEKIISGSAGGNHYYHIASASTKPVNNSSTITTALQLLVEDEEEMTERQGSTTTPQPRRQQLALTVNDKCNSVCVTVQEEDETKPSSCWNLEILSGELLFVRSSDDCSSVPLPGLAVGQQQQQQMQQIRCNVLGQLSMTSECKGWEVWRFIETGAGDGRVRIHSWMHQRYLGINYRNNEDGVPTVCTTTEPCTEWLVEKASSAFGGRGTDEGEEGVVIRVASESTNNNQEEDENDDEEERCSLLLCCTKDTNGQLLLGITTETDSTELGTGVVWQLDAAHQQIYTFHCTEDNRTIGPSPWVTDNHKQVDQFAVEVEEEFEEDNNNNNNNSSSIATTTATIRSIRKNQYVGVNSNAEHDNNKVVAFQDSPYKWQMIVNSDDGTYTFQQQQQQDDNRPKMFLSVHKHETENHTGPGQLSLQPSSSTMSSSRWRLDPVMPRAVSSSKIRTFVGGTTIAVATTIAMPFAVAGVVGLIGTEMGLLANAVAVTLTAAEATASVGVIGATAAICFRASRDSLSAALLLEDDDENEGAEESDLDERQKYTKRPFCDWRSW